MHLHLSFWHKIVAEKKHLEKRRNFLLTSSSLINNSNVVNAGTNTPDANSVAGAEGTTGGGGGGGSGNNVNTLGATGVNTALGTSATYNSISGLPNQNENNNCIYIFFKEFISFMFLNFFLFYNKIQMERTETSIITIVRRMVCPCRAQTRTVASLII